MTKQTIEKQCEELSINLHTQIIVCIQNDDFHFYEAVKDLMSIYQDVTSGKYDKVCLTNLRELADKLDALKSANRLYAKALIEYKKVLEYIEQMS